MSNPTHSPGAALCCPALPPPGPPPRVYATALDAGMRGRYLPLRTSLLARLGRPEWQARASRHDGSMGRGRVGQAKATSVLQRLQGVARRLREAVRGGGVTGLIY